MKCFKNKKLFIFIFGLVVVLSMFVLRTPKPTLSNVEGKFSAVRASEYIKEISKEPHSYYDRDELERVRVYLEDTLTTYLGSSNVETINYTTTEMKAVLPSNLHSLVEYPIANILAKIPGTNDEGILLVAHYDSRGHVGRAGELGRSYGAMDDGYGVATLLELVYLFKDLTPTNSIYFLFTDAEEVGLFGAYMAASDNSVMDNVRFVINVESRGRYGPTYMFETSKNNAKVIDLYKKANFPITYSMATAVYSVMPNSTDFTPFLPTNTPGLNFATLAGLDNYHSPLDSYEHINQSSIEHMGVQVEPIVREFISNGKYVEDGYFDAKADKVFFTIFAHTMISYSQPMAIILVVLAVVIFTGLVVYKVMQKEISLLKIFKEELPKGLIISLILIVSGYLFSNVVAFLGKVPFKITYTRVSGADYPTLIFMILVFSALVKKIKDGDKDNVLLIGIAFNALLGLLTTFFLPGASFLFTLTSLIGIAAHLINLFVKNKLAKQIVLPLLYAFLMFIIIPLLWSFYMALTVGGVALLVILLIINSSVLIPTILYHYEIE